MNKEGAEIFGFSSSVDFWRRVDADPDFLSSLDVLVVDRFLEDGSDGLALARAVRERCRARIVLSSSDLSAPGDHGVVDVLLGKDEIELVRLLALL